MIIGARPEWPFKIVEEPAVTAMITRSQVQWPRFDNIWEGLVWLIAHGGHKMGSERDFGGVGHRYYVYPGDQRAGFPRIIVVYRYFPETFYLKMLLVSEPRG